MGVESFCHPIRRRTPKFEDGCVRQILSTKGPRCSVLAELGENLHVALLIIAVKQLGKFSRHVWLCIGTCRIA